MPTVLTYIIDPDNGPGTDFTSLASWESSTRQNLVSNDVQMNVRCRSSNGSADTTELRINNAAWGFDSTHYIDIGPYPGQKHNGIWDDSKYRLSVSGPNGASAMVLANTSYIKVHDLQIENAGTASQVPFWVFGQSAGAGMRFYNNIIRRRGYWATEAPPWNSRLLAFEGWSMSDCRFYNNLVIDYLAGSHFNVFLYFDLPEQSLIFENNTFVQLVPNDRFVFEHISEISNTSRYRNNLVYSANGVWNHTTAAPPNSFNNVIHCKNHTTWTSVTKNGKNINFEDFNAGNYKLASNDIHCLKAGSVKSNLTQNISTDILGNPRPAKSPLDVGAFQVTEVPSLKHQDRRRTSLNRRNPQAKPARTSLTPLVRSKAIGYWKFNDSLESLINGHVLKSGKPTSITLNTSSSQYSGLQYCYPFAPPGTSTLSALVGSNASLLDGLESVGWDNDPNFGSIVNLENITSDSTQYIANNSFSWAGGPVTLSFWHYLASSNVLNVTAMYAGTPSDTDNRFLVHAPWGDWWLYWDYGNLGTGGRIATYYGDHLNKWTLITLVSAGSSGSFKAIYFDGQLNVSEASSSSPGVTLNGLVVGHYDGSPHKARFADFRIYNRVLNSTEIAQLYAPDTRWELYKVQDYAPGIKNNCLSLDGHSYLILPNHNDFNFVQGESFSVNVWFKGGSQTNYTGLIVKAPNTNPFTGWQMVVYNNRLAAEIHNGSTRLGPDTEGTVGSTLINDNQWHMLTMTMDKADRTLKLYVDGSQELSYTHDSVVNNHSNTAPLLVGAERTATLRVDGELDELLICNQLLQADEVTHLYASGRGKFL